MGASTPCAELRLRLRLRLKQRQRVRAGRMSQASVRDAPNLDLDFDTGHASRHLPVRLEMRLLHSSAPARPLYWH